MSFDNKLCAAYLNSGRASQYLDILQAEAEKVTKDDLLLLEEKFPRGAIAGIIEKHPELMPKCKLVTYITSWLFVFEVRYIF